MNVLSVFFNLFSSPLGPPLLLTLGAGTMLVLNRPLRRSSQQSALLTAVALAFVGVALLLTLRLRADEFVPIFSRPWQPLLQERSSLFWVGDGWNWYISLLILLLGGVGILLDWGGTPLRGIVIASGVEERRRSTTLAVNLAFLATALLFVGSGNLLTVIITWVVMDLVMLVRRAVRPEPPPLAADATPREAFITATLMAIRPVVQVSEYRVRGLSLIGALLLLIALLPAGAAGPGQPLQDGALPYETVYLMLVASVIRAGAYPFHLWLLPDEGERISLAERLLDHIVPVLCGLWLLGWTVDLGSAYLLLRPELIIIAVLMLLASAVAAWTATDQTNHTTFVLVTSAGLALLSGLLGFTQGPSALIWPTTAFALGGSLWVIGERVWREWGWQLPVSTGALALAGVPFTPGFLTQPALSRLLTGGSAVYTLLFVALVVAQALQIAALLRSWGSPRREPQHLHPATVVRLLLASVVVALPLVITGFLPEQVALIASLPDAIPPLLGSPPIVVAERPVWITLIVPLLLGVPLAIWRRPVWRGLGLWPERISRVSRLDWLMRGAWWSASQGSAAWGNAVVVLEGAGYLGWIAVFALLGYLLLS